MRKRRWRYRPPRRRENNAEKTAPPRRELRRGERRADAAAAFSPNLLRTVACGTLFVLLVALKLLLPGGLESFRGTLGEWLVRDADFVSAFSAVGHAVSGEGGVLDSLEEAYTAVFGDAPAEEVSAGVEIDWQPPEEDAERESESAPDMPARASALPRKLEFSYAAPLAGPLTVTSGFGWREHPASGTETFHYGVDLAAEEGEEVRCFADGTVGVVAESVELGKYLTVFHADGVSTLYAHCSQITAASGEAVKRGEKLAEAGSTGNATGPHLHFEVHDGEMYLDPACYLT